MSDQTDISLEVLSSKDKSSYRKKVISAAVHILILEPNDIEITSGTPVHDGKIVDYGSVLSVAAFEYFLEGSDGASFLFQLAPLLVELCLKKKCK